MEIDHILIVEDDKEIREGVEIYLKSQGYKVFQARDGVEGLEILDREDYIPDAYTFEVSSPGLGRPLKKDKDFERSLGEEVEIRLYRAVDSQKEYAGVLKAYDKDTVTIVTEDDTERTFQRSDISLIRLAFDF